MLINLGIVLFDKIVNIFPTDIKSNRVSDLL